MPIRQSYTTEEHILLTKVGDEFSDDLAKIAAKALNQFSPDIQYMVTYYLQDHTSLFSPYTVDKIVEELLRLQGEK